MKIELALLSLYLRATRLAHRSSTFKMGYFIQIWA